MRIKLGVKIGVISLLIVIIIAIGFVMFKKLNHNKNVFTIDLYIHIPSEVTGILQINKNKDVKIFASSFPDLEHIILSIENSLSYPILITETNQDIHIISKITSEQESRLKSLLNHNLFPSFSPKTRTYKDAKIYFYPADNNKFFTCMFHQGFFIGGYNYTLLEKFVDTDSSNNIFNNKHASEVVKKMKTSYPANLYFNNKTDLTSFNINLNKNDIELDGFTNSIYTESINVIATEDDSLSIDYSIFPDTLLSYTINTNISTISGSLSCLFNVPGYRFVLNNNLNSPIFALKHTQNRFDIFDQLNKLEENFIQKKFSTKDVVLNKQHIYSTSEQMGQEIFRHQSSVYFTFYKNYLIFTENRNTLIKYLANNGNYRMNPNLDSMNINTQTVSLFYSNDIQKFSPRYLESYHLIQKIVKGQMLIKNYIEEGQRKIEIVSTKL